MTLSMFAALVNILAYHCRLIASRPTIIIELGNILPQTTPFSIATEASPCRQKLWDVGMRRVGQPSSNLVSKQQQRQQGRFNQRQQQLQKYVQVEGLDTSKLLVNALDGENSSQQSNKN